MPRVTMDNLASAVMDILEKYGDDVTDLSYDAVKEVTKAGSQTLKGNPGGFGGSGKYSKGWTVTMEGDRMNPSGTIHNRKPGLPHLLEHGHAKRGGGWQGGKEHIAPVEKEVIEAFKEAIEKGVGG